MKKIYFFSFVGGLLLGGGVTAGSWGTIGEFASSLLWKPLWSPVVVSTIAIYFFVMFLIWLFFSLLFKKVLHLDKEKYRITLYTGLLGVSITASLFMYALTHITFGGF